MDLNSKTKQQILDIVLPFASVVVRVVAMGLCAAALSVLLLMASNSILPPAGSFDQSIARLGVCILTGIVLGAALGGLLTHRFARRTYERPERVGFALIAAAVFVILVGWMAFVETS